MTDDGMRGRVVLVTGASSGIGRATALRFAEAGCQVAAAARRVDRLQEVVQECEEAGGSGRAFPVDLTQPEARERLVAEVVEAFGGVDVLVNAAGILVTGDIRATDLETWRRMMDINLEAPFHLIRLTLPSLEARQGNVVNVSSVTGLRAFPGILAYCVSKAGLDQLTRCLALELAPHGVRVNAVNPGVVETELHLAGGMEPEAYRAFLEHSRTTHPLGRVGRPEEVAELTYYLASPRAAWITGVTYPIDGGRAQTCAR